MYSRHHDVQTIRDREHRAQVALWEHVLSIRVAGVDRHMRIQDLLWMCSDSGGSAIPRPEPLWTAWWYNGKNYTMLLCVFEPSVVSGWCILLNAIYVLL